MTPCYTKYRGDFDTDVNRLEVIRFLESFFAELNNAGKKDIAPFQNFVLSLKRELPLSISLLRELALLGLKAAQQSPGGPQSLSSPKIPLAGSGPRTGGSRPVAMADGILKRRLDRRYARLCRVQEELGRLDFKKAPPGVSPEDFIFSRIDFSRYREMSEKEFGDLFPEGLTDFDDGFFEKNFGLNKTEIQSLIEESYKKTAGTYIIRKESPSILSVLSIMRTLDTSLESSPLFTAEETLMELRNLLGFVGKGAGIPGIELLYPLLVLSLDNVCITHEDGMTTKLFISDGGDLAGTFLPGNKPWTLVLISAKS